MGNFFLHIFFSWKSVQTSFQDLISDQNPEIAQNVSNSAQRVPEPDTLPSIFVYTRPDLIQFWKSSGSGEPEILGNTRYLGWAPSFWYYPISGIPRHDSVFQLKHHDSAG